MTNNSSASFAIDQTNLLSVTGMIDNIRFHSPENGYTVALVAIEEDGENAEFGKNRTLRKKVSISLRNDNFSCRRKIHIDLRYLSICW